ncbi:hypothetical protein ScPMuIL_016288 [Solemya velum]
MDAEDLRKKRLAFFESQSSSKSDGSGVNESKLVNKHPTNELPHQKIPNKRESKSKGNNKSHALPDKVPEGYNENVEQLLRSVKQELYGTSQPIFPDHQTRKIDDSPSLVKNVAHVVNSNGTSTRGNERYNSHRPIIQVPDGNRGKILKKLPADSNSLHVHRNVPNSNSQEAANIEEMFASSHRSSDNHSKTQGVDFLSESQNFDKMSLFQKSVDFDTLGLATHRPESERDVAMVTEGGRNLEEMSIIENLRNVLSEDKYCELLEKSKNDIEHLKRDSDRTENTARTSEGQFITGSKHDRVALHSNIEKSYEEKYLSNNMSADQTNSFVDPSRKRRDTKETGQSQGRSYDGVSKFIENSKSKPKLSRPKEAPIQIDRSQLGTTTQPVPVKFQNYEQVVVSRNVAYHSDEIYRQAERMPTHFYGGVQTGPSNQYHANPHMYPPTVGAPQHYQPSPFTQSAMFNSLDIRPESPHGFYGYTSPQSPMIYQYSPIQLPHPPDQNRVGGFHQNFLFTSGSPNQMQGGALIQAVGPPEKSFQPKVFSPMQSIGQPLSNGQPVSRLNQMYEPGQFYAVDQQQNYHEPWQDFQKLDQQPNYHNQQWDKQPNYHDPRQDFQMVDHQQLLTQYSPQNNYNESRWDFHTGTCTNGSLSMSEKPNTTPLPHPPISKPTHVDRRTAAQRHVDGVRQHHQNQKLHNQDDMINEEGNYAEVSLDRYFSSLDPQYIPRTVADTMDERNAEVELNTSAEDGGETNVTQTDITIAGITDKMEDLGIDLPSLKSKVGVGKLPIDGEKESEKHKMATGLVEEEDGKAGKFIIRCPECSACNKTYMTWCGSCGEVLIGVEPVMFSASTTEETGQQKDVGNKTSTHKPLQTTKPDEDKSTSVVRKTNNTDVNGQISVDGTADRNKSIAEIKPSNKSTGVKKNKVGEFYSTQREVVDICETIKDPVIRGYVKSHFTKKREAVLHSSEHSLQSKNKTSDKSKTASPIHDKAESLTIDLNVGDSISSFSNSQVGEQKTKKIRRKKHGSAIDIEIFGVEDRDDVSSSRNPEVPVLNLVNSSDEEEEDDIEADGSDDNELLMHNGVPHQQAWLQDDSKDNLSADMRNHLPLSGLSRSDAVNDSGDHASGSKKWESLFERNTENIDGDEVAEFSEPFLAQLLHEEKERKKVAGSSPSNEKYRNIKNTRVPGNLSVPRGGKAKGKVREYVDQPPPKQHWARSSGVWSSHNSGRPMSAGYNIRKSASAENSKPARPSSGSVLPRKSASTDSVATRGKHRPFSADSSKRFRKDSKSKQLDQSNSRMKSHDCNSTGAGNDVRSIGQSVPPDVVPLSYPFTIEHRLPVDELPEHHSFQHDKVSAQNAYSRYLEMTPRLMEGHHSRWLLLPDELLLHVFSFLKISTLAKCGQVCKHFFRVAMDESLWRYITIRKNHDLNDDHLVQIGKRHPVSLALIRCHGDNISSRGLRVLFSDCANNLKELNFSCCSHGSLVGDCILLHASAHCHNLTHVDASWCNVTDSGIMAISQCCRRLESLCINGCQSITDEGFETVIKKHAQSLRVLEMFGCFSITPRAIRFLASQSQYLQTLNLGQCYKLKDECMSQLSASLGWIETLDLRGCRHIKDNCMRRVVKNCPHLHTIALANCPNISDVSLLEISTYLSGIRSIDVCGCKKITDTSVRAVANSCQQLHSLDISSTGCSQRSVSMLANFCNQSLRVVKLNFLADLTEACLIKLARHCKRLELLHVFGCRGLKTSTK